MQFDLMNIVALVVALVLALTLHEFAHAWVGTYLGDETARAQGRLSLNPLAHIDPFTTLALPLLLILVGSPVVFGAAKPVPFNPWAVRGGRWGAALVALAGPATNLLLAVFFGLWLRFVPISIEAGEFLFRMVTVNVGLFVFNMIPFPPLDGSRLLYALVPSGIRDVMDRLERNGLLLIFLIILIAFPLISPFIYAVSKFLINLIVPLGPLP